MKTVLITGSTDGIGKATAIELAKNGYTIHALGLNEKKGKETLSLLKKANPNGDHRLNLIDLSTIESNKKFLIEYKEENEKLDLLILCAGALPKKTIITKEGYDLTFAVGYISRYMFASSLNSILEKSEDSRVIYLGDYEVMKDLDFKRIEKPDYKPMTATTMGYMGCAQLVTFLQKNGFTKVAQEFMHPGHVNTQQMKSQNFLIRFLFKIIGSIEPEQAGKNIAQHILTTNTKEVSGKFYRAGKSKNVKKLNSKLNHFKEVLRFSEKLTGLKFE